MERGIDLNSCFCNFLNKGMLEEALLDQAITRVLTAHMKLGFFDSPDMVAYKRLPPETIDSAPHRALDSRPRGFAGSGAIAE